MAKPLIDLSDLNVWLSEWREARRAGGTGSGRFAAVPNGLLDGRACIDFAVLDYTTGPWPLAPSEIDLRIEVLQQFQSPSTGYFDADARPPTMPMSAFAPQAAEERAAEDEQMGQVQTTAYFLAALELLGSKPRQPIRAFESARTPGGLVELFESLDWKKASVESARAAGIASCFATLGDVGPEWFTKYLAWLDDNVDNKTGFWCEGAKCSGLSAVRGAYHQYMIYDRFCAPLPKPDRALKTALALQRKNGLFDSKGPGWAEVAAVYVIDRAFRQCGKTFTKVAAALTAVAKSAGKKLRNESFRTDATPHMMAGVLSLAALLARALPGSVRSARPLRFARDRRLFI